MLSEHAPCSWKQPPLKKRQLWNPWKTLEIINTDPGFQCITCIGYAPSQRRRCRNPIRSDNRNIITEVLDDISYLSPDNPDVMSQLRQIVERALCVRNHQNQAETVLMQWRRSLKQLPRPTKQDVHTAVRGTNIGNFQEELQTATEIIAQLQEEIKNLRQQDKGYLPRRIPTAEHRQQEETTRQRREEKDRKAKHDMNSSEKQRLEKKRLTKELLKKERLEKERLERERLEKECLEKEKCERENAARNERIRQRAHRLREEREQGEREKEYKEKEEWAQSWRKYQERWEQFRASTSRDGYIGDAIPWPMKSGLRCDAVISKVTEFLDTAMPKDESMKRNLRKECQKWHPDTIRIWLKGSKLTEVDRMIVDMICRVTTRLIDNSCKRSAESF